MMHGGQQTQPVIGSLGGDGLIELAILILILIILWWRNG